MPCGSLCRRTPSSNARKRRAATPTSSLEKRRSLPGGADVYIRSEVGENAFDILAGVQSVAIAEVLLAHDTRQLPWQWYIAFVRAIHGDNTNEAFIDDVVNGFVEEE